MVKVGPTSDLIKRTPSVAHVLGELKPHGAELRTLELIEDVHRKTSIKQHVIVISGSAGPLRQRFEVAGASVHVLDLRSPRFVTELGKVVRAHGIDVIHSHVDLINGYVLAASWIARVPVRICHMRTDNPFSLAGRGSILKSLVLALLIGICATHRLGVSPTAARSVPGWRKTSRRASVIYSGIDCQRIRKGRQIDNPEFRRSAESPVILHVSRDVPVKNRAFANRVHAELRAMGVDADLFFVGGETVENNPESGIYHLGTRNDVPALMSQADLLLSTSLVEGLPGAVLEAVAVGLPVLSSDVTGACLIGKRFGGVRIMSLSEDPVRWAIAAKELVGIGGRPKIDEIEGSEFDSALATSRFVDFWHSSANQVGMTFA